MLIFTLPPPGMNVALITLILSAAVYDVLYRRLPNWLTMCGVLAGLALNSFIYGDGPDFCCRSLVWLSASPPTSYCIRCVQWAG